MLFEMARDKLERQWAIPLIDEMIRDLSELPDRIKASARVYRKLLEWIQIEIAAL